MKRIIIYLTFLGLGCRCTTQNDYPLPNRCGYPSVVVTAYSGFETLFSEEINQLAAGDINSSVVWNDKRIWLIANGLLNTPSGKVRLKNCLLLQDAQGVSVLATKTGPTPQSFVGEPTADSWYSLNQGIINGTKLELVVTSWQRTGAGKFDAVPTGCQVISVNTATWQIENRKVITADTPILLGSALLQDGAYTYIYGSKSRNMYERDGFVARVKGSLLNDWAYFDGYNWQSSPTFLKPIFSDISDQYFSVFRADDHVYLVTQPALFSPQVKLLRGDSPEAGWSFQRVLYCRSGEYDDQIMVNAVSHFTDAEGRLICSYTLQPKDLTTDVARPSGFVAISQWK